MINQYHLKGKGFSGRAVRVREVDPIEAEENLKAAAKLVGSDASVLELKKTEWRNGVKLMVCEVSDPCDDPGTAKWRKVKPADLEDLGSLFKTKDVGVLEALYREMVEVMPGELESIMGKALPVSSEG